MSLSNAFTSLDIQNSKGITASNWEPQGTITYPSFSTNSRVTLTPYIKTAIEFTAQILGQTFDNAATITTQTNLGFDTQVLTSASQYKARSIEERFSLAHLLKGSSLVALLAKAAASVVNQVPKPPTCPVGGLLLTGSMSTTNQAYFGSGSPVGLYRYSYPFGSRCFVIPGAVVPVPSSTSTSPPPTSAASTIATSTLITTPVVTLSSTPTTAVTGPPTFSQPPAASTTSTSTPTPILLTTSTTTTTTATQSVSTTGFCPSGFACGAITEGTSQYNLNCGMTMSSQTLEIGSAGPGANIHTMADCLDWCNRYGTYCQVALWDTTQYNSCILFTGVGSTAISSTAAYAVRAVPPIAAALYCPPGFSAGPLSQGGSNYQLTCGESMGGQGAAFASAGARSGINTMGDCLNWCNSWGGACQVAEWDSSISNSCLLFGAVGTGTGSSTAAVAVRA
ncbi:MAG: hypothetical protein LQ347_003786 [Umbilicaria vellea]|nr:MAG: hypothetical protein LQ347_003786 [Umbilicaria vellea]